jgi:Rifampin ADP-ribosyl transferase
MPESLTEDSRRLICESIQLNKDIIDPVDDLQAKRFYHGTRAGLKPGDLIRPGNAPDVGAQDRMAIHVCLSPNLDEAIWDAELALGEGPARVYVVEPAGRVRDASRLPHWKSPGHPSMSFYSTEPLRVAGEVTTWVLYHGTRANLRPGNLIKPGYDSNFGNRAKASYVYFTRTLDAATWGAELAVGDGPGRIYVVEPTGPMEDDPDLTDRKFRGNPTKSFRSREPLRITGEITAWKGHTPEALDAMKDGIRRIERRRLEPVDD